MKAIWITMLSVPMFWLASASNAIAGNCLVQGDKKIGDCGNVHVGPGLPKKVTRSEYLSGNYGAVTIERPAVATINGNTENIVVQRGATLVQSGNSRDIEVAGNAEINGNAGWITVRPGAKVTIRGIVEGVAGNGDIKKMQGAIIGGVYIR